MGDQVNRLWSLMPAEYQLGRAPCCTGRTCGATACTDNCVAEIVRAETGRRVFPASVRALSGRPMCLGLRPSDVLNVLKKYGVKGYVYKSGVTVEEVLRATDRGVVLVGVGYRLYPRKRGISGPGGVAEIGGKTDTGFRGAHAITVWGRRTWTSKPRNWTPRTLQFSPGTRVWTRDPDHRQATMPAYDRISIGQLREAMRAIVTDTPWQSTFAIWKA